MSMEMNKTNNLNQLTWLRGLAALFVLFTHINRTNETSYIGESIQTFWLLDILDLGSFGVTLFFTLSGCTLYLSASRSGFKTMDSYYQFFIKRFLRIWPVFAISLIIYIVAGELFNENLLPYQEEWIAKQFIMPFTYSDVVNYLFLIFNFTGPAGLFNNAFWSLPVEFQYYLTLPIVYFLVQRFGGVGLLIVVIFSHILYKLTFNSFESTLVFRLFFTFSLGVYAGYLFKIINFRLNAGLALATMIFFMSVVYFYQEGYFNHLPLPSEWVIYGFISVICVFISIFSNITLPKPIAKVLYFYGEISYSLYLIHNLILMISVLLFIYFQTWLEPFKLLFISITAISGSTILAFLSYKFIENPSIKLGRSLKKHVKNHYI